MEDVITLYPSNWLYNAGVIGFLMSLSEVEKIEVESWFKDNLVEIPRSVFTKLKVKERYFGEGKIASIIGKSELYRNYINPSRKKDKENFPFFVEKLSKVAEIGEEFCIFCSRNFALPTEIIEELLSSWDGFKDTFLPNLQKYGVAHNNLLAPSAGEFPNALWHGNRKSSFYVCPLCSFFIIHHHIPFAKNKTLNGEIFINAPSFKVMWYLNKFVEEILSKNNSYDLRKILGISFIEFAQRVHITLGAWSVMNIEMIIKKGENVDYYSLPYHISCILLQKDIASLISQTKEPVVLETVLKGDFEELLRLSHAIIRALSTGNRKDIPSELKSTKEQNLKELSKILPELYVKINSIIKSEVRSWVSMKK